jgi:hypothetical protein
MWVSYSQDRRSPQGERDSRAQVRSSRSTVTFTHSASRRNPQAQAQGGFPMTGTMGTAEQ